ncbi:repressor protein CI [Serratia phage vB_SmaM-ChibiTotoro]|nr:repressor protein CI [Serratia phage vB_SmaM-ChibiTotoro]URC22439.1 repressor protein CI [Serratia phage vB_SmaM-Susuwatari]
MAKTELPNEIKTTGDRIRVARVNAGMSQIALAKAAGTSQDRISSIETGRNVPTVAVLSRIADALGVQISNLI